MRYTLVYWDPPSKNARAARRTHRTLLRGEQGVGLRDLPVENILADLREHFRGEWSPLGERAWSNTKGSRVQISGTKQFVQIDTDAIDANGLELFDELFAKHNCRSQVFEQRHEVTEDLLSAIALGKTIAFLFYSLLAGFLALGFALAAVNNWYPAVDTNLAMLASFTLLEAVFLVLVIKGWLPATSGRAAGPFSEKHAAWGLAVLSFAPWLFSHDPTWFVAFMWLINGTLVLSTAVFFVTKSVLSGRIRVEVLGVLLAPAMQLLIGKLWRGA